MQVRCIECGLPGTFYKEVNKQLVKVTDNFVRITKDKSDIAIYAHQKCAEEHDRIR